MRAETKCTRCEPAGSGQCRDCRSVRNPESECVMCYGSGYCRYCDGTGLQKSTLDRCKDMLLSVWWVSWFGIVPSFFIVGVWETWYIASQRRGASRYSLTVLIVTSLLWVLFYFVDNKARERVDGVKNRLVVVELLTIIGTVLAIFTLLQIFFFIHIAPRIQ